MQPDTLWGKIKQGIKESATTAAVKAEHLGKLGRIRLDMARTRQAIQSAQTELGGHVYRLLQQTPDVIVPQQEAVQKQIQIIRELEAKLKIQEAEFQTLQTTDVEPTPLSDEES